MLRAPKEALSGSHEMQSKKFTIMHYNSSCHNTVYLGKFYPRTINSYTQWHISIERPPLGTQHSAPSTATPLFQEVTLSTSGDLELGFLGLQV